MTQMSAQAAQTSLTEANGMCISKQSICSCKVAEQQHCARLVLWGLDIVMQVLK